MGGYSLRNRRSKHHQHVSKPFCEKNAITKTFRVTRTLPPFPDKPIGEALIKASVFRKTASRLGTVVSRSPGNSHQHTAALDRVVLVQMDTDSLNSKANTDFRPSAVAKGLSGQQEVLSPERCHRPLPDSRASVDMAGRDSHQYSAPHTVRPTSDKEPNMAGKGNAIHRKDALRLPTAVPDDSYPQTDQSSMNCGYG